MSLFQRGKFILNSGSESDWKIDCDALTDDDIECVAYLISRMVGPFSTVEGVPTGGLRLAAAVQKYGIVKHVSEQQHPHLIVDDVLTTGGSMERAMKADGRTCIGAVIFARGPCPKWVKPLFQLFQFRLPIWYAMNESADKTIQRKIDPANFSGYPEIEAWTQFACAAMRDDIAIESAANIADKMLAELKKRFVAK